MSYLLAAVGCINHAIPEHYLHALVSLIASAACLLVRAPPAHAHSYSFRLARALVCLCTRTIVCFGAPARAPVCCTHTRAPTHIFIFALARCARTFVHTRSHIHHSRVYAHALHVRAREHTHAQTHFFACTSACARAPYSQTRRRLRVRSRHMHHCKSKQSCSSCMPSLARDRKTRTISRTPLFAWRARAFSHLRAHHARAAHAGAPRSSLFSCASVRESILTRASLPPYYTRIRTPTSKQNTADVYVFSPTVDITQRHALPLFIATHVLAHACFVRATPTHGYFHTFVELLCSLSHNHPRASTLGHGRK